MSYCMNCGTKLIDGAKFCFSCGQPIKDYSYFAKNNNNPTVECEVTEDNDEETYEYETQESTESEKGDPLRRTELLSFLCIILAVCLGKIWFLSIVFLILAFVGSVVTVLRKENNRTLAIITLVIAALFVANDARTTLEPENTNNKIERVENTKQNSSVVSVKPTQQPIAKEKMEFGGLCFETPTGYLLEDDWMGTADGESGFGFFSFGSSLSTQEFKDLENDVDKIAKKIYSDSFSINQRSASWISIAGMKAIKVIYTGVYDNDNVVFYFVLVNDKFGDEIIGILGASPETDAEKLAGAFDELVNSASVSPNGSVNKKENSGNLITKESNGVNPDLKATLDEYEDFVDEYIAFMNNYKSNPSDLSLLLSYTSFISEMYDFTEKIEAYDDAEMSDEDLAYYLEVTTRCTQKLLKAAQ